MKIFTRIALAASLAAVLASAPAQAQHRGHGRGGVHFGIGIGVPFYGFRPYPLYPPYYPPYYYYPPVQVVPAPPPVYIERQDLPQYEPLPQVQPQVQAPPPPQTQSQAERLVLLPRQQNLLSLRATVRRRMAARHTAPAWPVRMEIAMFTMKRFAPLCAVLTLGACVTYPPSGPSMMALPGTGKNFDQFRMSDAQCRDYASSQAGGATAAQAAQDSGARSAVLGTAVGAIAGAAIGGGQGAAVGAGTGLIVGSAAGTNASSRSAYGMQQRYDNAYTQCMYANGHKVPVSGRLTESAAPAQRNYPPPPPRNAPPYPPSNYAPLYPPPPPGR
jgi:hypothetical protein